MVLCLKYDLVKKQNEEDLKLLKAHFLLHKILAIRNNK